MELKKKLFGGADPFLLCHDGMYYLYCTTENGAGIKGEKDNGFFVHNSADLVHWENRGLCLAKDNVLGEKWFWAPEVYAYRGRFYMLYSAETHMAVAVADSPLGPFVRHSDGWLRAESSIDGHFLFDDDGAVYLYYARMGDGEEQIRVAKMADDLTHIEQDFDTPLIRVEEPWETVAGRVAEGPFVLKHGGRYYLSYSCNNCECEDYAIGYAVADAPTGPFTKYENNPIYRRNGEVVGTGHHSFCPTDDPNRFIAAFHCHSGWAESFQPRLVCLTGARFVPQNGGADVLYMGDD